MHHIPPWKDPQSWNQIEPFFRFSNRNITQPARLINLALDIMSTIDNVDEELQALCRQSCPQCLDRCCARATIWYDFRDLLFLYYVKGTLPRQQLSRDSNHCCIQLGAQGCLLPRSERPFICTWYMCPEQMKVVRDFQSCNASSNILKQLKDMQKKRHQLEQLFYRAVLPT